jgi:iron-sulfur cluster repair protein YtfE (RIC family)
MPTAQPESDDWRKLPAMIMMLASHDAFRRDLADFLKFVHAGRAVSPDVLRGWSDFMRLLDNHHRGEDDFLWPIARRYLGGDTRRAESLDRMHAEHSELDPLLEQVGRGWTDTTGDVGSALEQLRIKLDEHLQDEEQRVLPWLCQQLTEADWKEYQKASRTSTDKKLPLIFLPWIFYHRDGRREPGPDAVIPAVLRLLIRTLMMPGYVKRQAWRA